MREVSNEKKGPNGCLFRVYVGDEKSYPVLCGWITSLNNQDFKESKAVFFFRGSTEILLRIYIGP